MEKDVACHPQGTLSGGWLQLLWQQGEDVMSHNDPGPATRPSRSRAHTASWEPSRDLIKGICSVITTGFPPSCIQLWKQPSHRTPAPDLQRALSPHLCRVQSVSPQRPRVKCRHSVSTQPRSQGTRREEAARGLCRRQASRSVTKGSDTASP